MATLQKDPLLRAVSYARNRTPDQAISLVATNPELFAVISKLNQSSEPAKRDREGNRSDDQIDPRNYQNISDAVTTSVSDAQTIMDICPDVKLCRQVLSSCILAPKDMVTTELTYSAPENLTTPEVALALTSRLREHFEQDYKIKSILPHIVEDAHFNVGSYVVVTLPENAIDELINRTTAPSMESLRDHFHQTDGGLKTSGLLGPNDRKMEERKKQASRSSFVFESYMQHNQTNYATESIRFEGEGEHATPSLEEGMIKVTDNVDVLKMPLVDARLRQARVNDAMPGIYSAESHLKRQSFNDRQLEQSLYKQVQSRFMPLQRLMGEDQIARRSVGDPLTLHVPSEAVIPVFVPGSPEKQVGFFLLLDELGHPINNTTDPNYYQEMSSRLKNGGSFASAMIQKVKSETTGFDYNDRRHIADSVKVFSNMVEADLLQRLRNGVYGTGAKIASREEIYRIMFSRALSKQRTQLLFVPAEMVTYFAFQYNKDGVGQSLIESMKILFAIRVQLSFANTMASLRNSIGRTNMKVKFDAEDPSPEKTLETAIHEVNRQRQNYFPLGMITPTDVTDWMQRASFQVTWEGHPGMPDLGIEFENVNSNIAKPDSELEENFRKQTIMGFNLSPESIDAGYQAEFATSVLNNNILLAKRVIVDQEKLEPLIARHARQNARMTPRLVNDLRTILLDHINELVKVDKHPDAGQSQSAAITDQVIIKNDQDRFKAAMKKRVKDQNDGEDVEKDDADPFGGGDAGFGGGFGGDASADLDNPDQAATAGVGAAEGDAADITATDDEKKEDKEYPAEAIKTISAWSAIPAADTGLATLPQTKVSDDVSTVGKKVKDRYTHDQLVHVEMVLESFLAGFEVSLPRPNSVTMENQSTALQQYMDMLEKSLDAVFSEKFFNQSLEGDIAALVEVWKENIRGYFIRKFMADNGIMPELSDLTTINDGKPVLDLKQAIVAHLTGLMKTLGEGTVQLKVIAAATDKILDAAGVKTDDAAGGFGGGGFGGDSGGFGDAGGFDTGSADGGFGGLGASDYGTPPAAGGAGEPPATPEMPGF